MPGLRRKVKVRKSALICGISAAVFGLSLKGRARKSKASGVSTMPATTVREYRSEICAGSKPVSAIGKA